MKTELYENSPWYVQKEMSDPPGKEQTEDVKLLINFRKDLDEQISELLKQRKEFNDLIEKNCTHPNENRCLISYYLTDTIGMNGYGVYKIICRDCGKNIREYERH